MSRVLISLMIVFNISSVYAIEDFSTLLGECLIYDSTHPVIDRDGHKVQFYSSENNYDPDYVKENGLSPLVLRYLDKRQNVIEIPKVLDAMYFENTLFNINGIMMSNPEKPHTPILSFNSKRGTSAYSQRYSEGLSIDFHVEFYGCDVDYREMRKIYELGQDL